MNKKGNMVSNLPVLLIGLLIAIYFMAALLPTIITNVSSTDTWGGSSTVASMAVVVFPLVIIGGLILLLLRAFGMGGVK